MKIRFLSFELGLNRGSFWRWQNCDRSFERVVQLDGFFSDYWLNKDGCLFDAARQYDVEIQDDKGKYDQ